MEALKHLEERLSQAVAETLEVGAKDNEDSITDDRDAVFLHANGGAHNSQTYTRASSEEMPDFFTSSRSTPLSSSPARKRLQKARLNGQSGATGISQGSSIDGTAKKGPASSRATVPNPEFLHSATGALERHRGEIESLRPTYTLEEFRNSSQGSAKAAVNSLLTSERVLRPLRSLLVQAYLQKPDRFSINLGELLAELVEEDEMARRDAVLDSDKQPTTQKRVDELNSGNHEYYLAVDMLEVELANTLSTSSLFQPEEVTAKQLGYLNPNLSRASEAATSPMRSQNLRSSNGLQRKLSSNFNGDAATAATAATSATSATSATAEYLVESLHWSGPQRGHSNSSRRRSSPSKATSTPRPTSTTKSRHRSLAGGSNERRSRSATRNTGRRKPNSITAETKRRPSSKGPSQRPDPLAETVLMWKHGQEDQISPTQDLCNAHRAGDLAWKPLREIHGQDYELDGSINLGGGRFEVDSDLQDMVADVDEAFLSTSARRRPNTAQHPSVAQHQNNRAFQRPSATQSGKQSSRGVKSSQRGVKSSKTSTKKRSTNAGLARLLRDTVSTRARQQQQQ